MSHIKISENEELVRDHMMVRGCVMKSLVDPADFPAARKYAYLNAASVALMCKGAADAVLDWQRDIAENGTMNFDEKAEEKTFQDLHRAAARLFRAEAEDIAVGSSATELMSSLAWAAAPSQGKSVVSTDITHPSTIYPWIRVARHMGSEVRWARGRDGHVNPADLARLIDERTAIVCVSHVEYGGGQLYDLADLADRVHDHGGLLIVDATQSAGAVPIDVTAWDVDALVSSAYKWLCGPFGVALLYLAPHLQSSLEPGLVGWRSHREMWNFQADRLEYSNTASRFEFSTMAYGSAIGLTQAVEYLLKVGVERIFQHDRRLADLLVHGLEERKAEVISPKNEEERSPIVAARFPGRSASEVAGRLNEAGVIVSARKDFVRFSPHLYNETEDIQRALEEIERILG